MVSVNSGIRAVPRVCIRMFPNARTHAGMSTEEYVKTINLCAWTLS